MKALLIGIVVGVIFFGGLYYTVQKINEVKYPNLLMGLSFIIRMAVLVAVFFYLSKSGWKDITFALIGVMAARLVITFTLKT